MSCSFIWRFFVRHVWKLETHIHKLTNFYGCLIYIYYFWLLPCWLNWTEINSGTSYTADTVSASWNSYTSCNLCTACMLAEYVSSKSQPFLYCLCFDVVLCFVRVPDLSSIVGLEGHHAVWVSAISTSKPVDEVMWILIWTWCHRGSPQSFMFNCLQYDENMVDVQTHEAEEILTPHMVQSVLLFQIAANWYKRAYLWKWMIFAS